MMPAIMEMNRAQLDVVIKYLLEKANEEVVATNKTDSCYSIYTGFFRYSIDQEFQIMLDYIANHFEADFFANELRKAVVEELDYYTIRLVLCHVEFFILLHRGKQLEKLCKIEKL
jgi:hypothetical protein